MASISKKIVITTHRRETTSIRAYTVARRNGSCKPGARPTGIEWERTAKAAEAENPRETAGAVTSDKE